jgi:hypothetical protein
MGDMEVPAVRREGEMEHFDALQLAWGVMKFDTGHFCPALTSGEIPLETLLKIRQFTARSESGGNGEVSEHI